MNAVALTLMLVVANAMGIGMTVPQVVRLHRLRSADGVSGVWIGVGIAMNAWWIAYCLAESLWGVLPVSTVAAVLYTVMAGQYLALVGSPGSRPLLSGLTVVGFAPLPFLVLGGWSVAGVVVGLTYAVQFAPAAVAAVRSTDLSGVSPVTWAMAWVEAVVWLLYGVSTGDVALLVGGIGGTLAATVILVRLSPRSVGRAWR